MTRINRKVEYALIALRHMKAKPADSLTTAREISDLYGAPFDATARVLQVLARQGLLKSEQGVNGGYIIARDLKAVSLMDLMEWLLGPVAVARCLSEGVHGDGNEGPCEIRQTCNIVSPIMMLQKRLGDFYRDLPVLDLLSVRAIEPSRSTEGAYHG